MAVSASKKVPSTNAMAFVASGVCRGRYSLKNISSDTGINVVDLKNYIEHYNNVPADVADKICLSVYGLNANILWQYYNIDLMPDAESVRLKRQIEMLRAWTNIRNRHQRMLHENARATALLLRFHEAGITTLEDFCNVVQAVFPKVTVKDASNYWLMFDCDYILSFDIEHALETVLQGRKIPNA